MIVVIQCAARKRDNAGTLRQRDGTPVVFVANPKVMPVGSGHVYAHPDDMSDKGVSWRDRLLDYNRNPGSNVLGLMPAWKLYKQPIYSDLVRKYGIKRVYILSAGWG